MVSKIFSQLLACIVHWYWFWVGKKHLGEAACQSTQVREAKLLPLTAMGKAKWIVAIALWVVSQLSGSSESRSTSTRCLQCFTDRLLHFYIWLRFLLLTLGRINSQTFCNCPWDWTGHFHYGKNMKRNKWHILVDGNDICGVRRQPAWALSKF